MFALTVAAGVVALLLLPRQFCFCFSNTFTKAAFGTAVYNAVFSL
jgi:hypothetical protein